MSRPPIAMIDHVRKDNKTFGRFESQLENTLNLIKQVEDTEIGVPRGLVTFKKRIEEVVEAKELAR